MEHEKFHYKTKEELKAKLEELKVTLPLSENLDVLKRPVQIGSKTAANAIAIQPMEGCDGTADGRPDALTLRRYDRFAKSGAGLIWAEAVAVVPEGRANPRQLWIHEENLADFQKFVADIKETCIRENGFEPIVIMQATHSGRYSKPQGTPAPLIAYNNPIFEGDNPISSDRILSDEYLFALEEKFAEAAKLAERAGFDGVDIKCCHRYLNSELLSAYTREGAFGGSLENRTRLLRHGVKNAMDATGKDFIVTSRLNVYDGFPHPYGFGVRPGAGTEVDLTEPLELIGRLHNELGMQLLDITIGNPYFNPHVNTLRQRPVCAGRASARGRGSHVSLCRRCAEGIPRSQGHFVRSELSASVLGQSGSRCHRSGLLHHGRLWQRSLCLPAVCKRSAAHR